jgi:hypothetical protein
MILANQPLAFAACVYESWTNLRKNLHPAVVYFTARAGARTLPMSAILA